MTRPRRMLAPCLLVLAVASSPSGADPFPDHRPPNSGVPDDVVNRMRQEQPKLLECAHRHNVSTRLELRFDLTRGGRVRNATASGGTQPLRRCVLGIVGRTRFDRKRRPRSSIRYSLGLHVPERVSARTLARNLAAMQWRFERCGSQHGFSGRLDFRATLQKNGRLRAITVRGGDALLRRCLRRSLLKGTFPRALNGQTFNYPLRIGTKPESRPRAPDPVVAHPPPPKPRRRSAVGPDRDGDGVADADDLCPDALEDHDQFEDIDGCPDPDNDGDRIADADDQCPNEPENYNGRDDEDGCPDRSHCPISTP